MFVFSYLTKIGLLPYGQIMDQHFPGLFFFPVNLASIGFDTLTEYRFLQLFLVFLNHILIYLIVKEIFVDKKFIFLVNFFYLIWQLVFEGYVLWIDSFVVPIFLICFLILIKAKSKIDYFWAGFILGLGLLFKQVVAPLIILVWFYLLKNLKEKRNIFWFSAGAVLPGILMCFYFFYIGVWDDFWYWTVVFNLTFYAELGRKYPSLGQIVKTAIVFGFTFVVAFFIYWKKEIERQVLLAFLFMLGALFFAYTRFEYVHLQPALPFALIIVVYFFYTTKRFKMLFLYFALSAFVLLYSLKSLFGNKTYFFTDHEKKLTQEVQRYALPNDPVFAMATTPHIYYLTNTRPPGNVFAFPFEWFMKVAEPKILDGIKSEKPKVVLKDSLANLDGKNLVNHMPQIEEYINLHYTIVNKIGSVDILIPNENSD